MPSKITTILTGYNRPHILDEQIESIRSQTIPSSEIWLWYNQSDHDASKFSGKVDKEAICNHNFKFFGRFAFSMLAQTEYIAIFDDDTIPGKKWFENCLNCMKTHPGIYGTAGIVLHGDFYHPHTKIGWASPRPHITEVDLVGHAWFFKKSTLSNMWKEEPYSYDNGEDIHFSFTSQKYAGVKTYVPPHPNEDSEMWGSLKGVAYGSGPEASWKKSSHGQLRNEIVANAVKNGWKPLYLR